MWTMRSAYSANPEKIYVISFASFAALAALLYVIFGPKTSNKPRRKLATKDSCPGLLNQGNSCFLNAILQACSTSQSFRQWLEGRRNHSSGIQLSDRLLDILKVLNNEVDEGDYGNPYDVIEALRAKRWVISSDEQDAHELFEVLTQSLDEDRTMTQSVVPLFDVAKLEVGGCESCVNRWGTELPRLVRDKRHAYQGLLASNLQCRRCHYTCPIKYDPFDCLSLSLPTQRMGLCDLNHLLNTFIRPEKVDDVECEGCTKKQRQFNPDVEPLPNKSTFTKQTRLGKLPSAICLHVQRTVWLNNGMACKRSDHVSFPEYLCMDAYTNTTRAGVQTKGLLGGRATSTTPSSQTVRNLSAVAKSVDILSKSVPPSEPTGRLYRLDAVIEHLGDVTSGHFVTHRRAPYSTITRMASPSWLYTSDTIVRRTKWTRVKECTAYMLFYERVSF